MYQPILVLILTSANLVWAQQNVPSVVIIGAGASGIAAGSRLSDAGFNVTILEAENRLGGRIHSVKFGDAIVDIGAEWCHGEVDNVVFQLVQKYNVLRHSNYRYDFYFSDRHRITDEFTQELRDLFDSTYNSAGYPNSPPEVSIGEHWLRIFNSTITETFGAETYKFYKAFLSLEPFKGYVLTDCGAYSWFDAPVQNTYLECEGDMELNWNGKGYKTVLDVLLKRFPVVDPTYHLDEHIELGKEVVEIIYEDDYAAVLCTDGSSYNADHVIFTPSLGVLKHRSEQLFTPPLPAQKADVINELGIDGVMKVLLHFPYRWWPDSLGAWILSWSVEDRELLHVEFPEGPKQFEHHWLRDLMTVYRLEQNDQALSIWFTGKYVPDLEKMDEKLLIKGIMFALNKFFGDYYTIPEPDKVLRADWATNPHFRGVYSYQTVDSKKHLRIPNDILAEPVLNSRGIPRLQFAGEATHSKYYSTVHGAIESGFREADRLIKLYKN